MSEETEAVSENPTEGNPHMEVITRIDVDEKTAESVGHGLPEDFGVVRDYTWDCAYYLVRWRDA